MTCRSGMRYTLPYQFQGAAKQRLELGGGGARALRLSDRGLRLRPGAPQVQQRREHVLLDGAERHGGRRRWLAGNRWQLVTEFEHHTLGRLLADARDANESLDFTAPDRVDQVACGQAGQDFDRQGRADSTDADEFFKQGFLV